MLAAIVVLPRYGGGHDLQGALAGPVSLIVGVPSLAGLIAGIGLLRYRPWARILTLVLSATDLTTIPYGILPDVLWGPVDLYFPFGTALGIGIYGFWVLLSNQTRRLFAQS